MNVTMCDLCDEKFYYHPSQQAGIWPRRFSVNQLGAGDLGFDLCQACAEKITQAFPRLDGRLGVWLPKAKVIP